MKRSRKPFFSSSKEGASKTRKNNSSLNFWSAIKLLFSITVETRPPSSFIYLLFTGICFGILFIVMGFVLMFHFDINDHRTIILFSILYFIYGFCITLIQNIYLISLGTARILFLITFALFFILVNLLAGWLGFDYIPWGL